jgi:hypothetical protein
MYDGARRFLNAQKAFGIEASTSFNWRYETLLNLKYQSLITRLLKFAFLGGLILLASPGTAFAYLDPGSGTMILQAIVGALAGGYLIIKKYWYQIKNFFSDTDQTPKKD